MSYQEKYEFYKTMVESRLERAFPGPGLHEAMRYSLLAGGKRVRPVLTLAFCEAAGGKAETALDVGCGVEMLHTYSLIHDDLPCMDNDDLRRGKPTNHKVYGETIAVLAGDALQAAAFQAVLSAPLDAAVRARAGKLLADAVGPTGMCLGQYRDTLEDGKLHTVQELTAINDTKTGALLRAACTMGVTAAGGEGAEEEQRLAAARDYATDLGLAFQIRDDILDVISTAEELGKPIGSDAANQKSTFASLLGVEECEKLVEEYTRKAKAALDRTSWSGDVTFLRELADAMVARES
ncbi:MAG: polyprenyl synthetase family protein [Oscillospiraceae bacterium]|nr:polyprenyl synthetase family protein [Oscillospiraceae bacterium]